MPVRTFYFLLLFFFSLRFVSLNRCSQSIVFTKQWIWCTNKTNLNQYFQFFFSLSLNYFIWLFICCTLLLFCIVYLHFVFRHLFCAIIIHTVRCCITFDGVEKKTKIDRLFFSPLHWSMKPDGLFDRRTYKCCLDLLISKRKSSRRTITLLDRSIDVVDIQKRMSATFFFHLKMTDRQIVSQTDHLSTAR